MSRSARLVVIAILCGVGVLATANPAPAQFVGGFVGPGGPFPYPIPPTTPLRFNYGYQTSFSVGTGIGPTISYSQGAYGPIGYAMQQRFRSPAYSAYDPLSVQVYGGYMTGGVLNPANEAAKRDLARAQRAAAIQTNPAPARMAIFDQWAYEKLGVTGLPALKPGQDMPAALARAMAANNEPEVASGEALNHILVAAVAAEGKGGKGQSAFLPPDLLADVRFAGSPTADTLNLLRRAGKLDIPAAFNAPALAEVRQSLERAFAAAVAPVLVGKAADPSKVANLEDVVKKARAALDPTIRDLDFEDATAARRFLNQLDAATPVLKGSGTASLIDPRWGTEGTNIADLIKYMTKLKILFGPAPKGNEDVYVALHRGLAAYLYILNESQKAPPKK